MINDQDYAQGVTKFKLFLFKPITNWTIEFIIKNQGLKITTCISESCLALELLNQISVFRAQSYQLHQHGTQVMAKFIHNSQKKVVQRNEISPHQTIVKFQF